MKFSRSIIWKTYSIKRSMQKFFESGHFSRGKGFRCHKKRNRFRERTTVTHSQIDRLAWKLWSNTINDQMKPIHRRWVDIWSQGDNLVNQVAEWSPSAVVWDRFLRWALMKSRNILVFTNTCCFEAWIDKYSTVHTQCCSSSRQNAVNGSFKSNPQRPQSMAYP